MEVGAKRRLNSTSNENRQTDTLTHGHTDGHFDLSRASTLRADALKIIISGSRLSWMIKTNLVGNLDIPA